MNVVTAHSSITTHPHIMYIYTHKKNTAHGLILVVKHATIIIVIISHVHYICVFSAGDFMTVDKAFLLFIIKCMGRLCMSGISCRLFAHTFSKLNAFCKNHASVYYTF